MTPVTPPDGTPGGLFIADFYPEFGAYLARRHASGYDAVAARARFLLWLAEHVSEDDMVAAYLTRAGQVPPLTAEEEAGLAARMAAGRRAEERLAEGDPDASLTRTAQDGARAGDLLAEASLGLVVAIARRYVGRGVPFPALVQAGNVGLDRARQKYDHAKGYRFSTYATWWIRQAITRRLADELLRVPVQALPHQSFPDQAPPAGVTDSLVSTEQQVRRALGREPTPEELAAELDPSV